MKNEEIKKSGKKGGSGMGKGMAGLAVASTILYFLSGEAEADGQELAGNLVDYIRHTEDGEGEMAELDALAAAIKLGVMAGSYALTLSIWEQISQ